MLHFAFERIFFSLETFLESLQEIHVNKKNLVSHIVIYSFSLNVDENPPPTPPPAAVVDETLEKELEKLENENEELEEQPEDGIIDDDKPEENDPAEESNTEIKEEDESNNPEEVLTSG